MTLSQNFGNKWVNKLVGIYIINLKCVNNYTKRTINMKLNENRHNNNYPLLLLVGKWNIHY